MNWFTRVRNSITSLSKRSTDKDLWVKCPSCQQMVFAQEYEDNAYVCPRCDHHGRIGADERLRQLMDEGFEVLPIPDVKEDPLKFRDTAKYTDRLKKARAKSPHKDAFLVGSGAIDGKPAVVGVQDFGFMGGSMGMAVGTAFCQGAERALTRRCPYIVVTAAGGARMQEGALSLMQLAKTSSKLARFSDEGGLYIPILTDPTTGGVTASYGMLGDIILAEPGALIGFAGPRVIKQTIGQDLPEGFQRAEFLQQKGFVDHIVSREEMKSTLANLIRILT